MRISGRSGVKLEYLTDQSAGPGGPLVPAGKGSQS